MNVGRDPATVRLLFVCTGNMCRSAAADRMMSEWAARLATPVLVRSAGTRARTGRPVHPRTESALEDYGVSGDGFTSRHLGPDDVDWADLVLTMTSQHREEVVGVSPRGMQKIFTLVEAGALCKTLRPELLHPTGESRGAVLADVLREARSRYARAHGPEFDIVDPIDGPISLHVQVVAQIAAALQPLMDVLAPTALHDQTVRMPRLPPVPPAR